MRWAGVEPARPRGTWPSTTPVCQFQHQRESNRIIIWGLNLSIKSFLDTDFTELADCILNNQNIEF